MVQAYRRGIPTLWVCGVGGRGEGEKMRTVERDSGERPGRNQGEPRLEVKIPYVKNIKPRLLWGVAGTQELDR